MFLPPLSSCLRISFTLATLFMMEPVSSLLAMEPVPLKKVALWPGGEAPVGGGATERSSVSITVHAPLQPNGTAMVICPGGGYGGLVIGAEGHGIAEWLNAHGIIGVVLEYRLPRGNAVLPLADAQRAIRMTRAFAKDWKINPDKIGIIGFSAGGHLASTAGTHFAEGQPGAEDPVERVSCRPDFMVLIYPVITMGSGAHGGSKKNLLGENPSAEAVQQFSNELQVTARTPPAFLAHALNDTLVPPEHSAKFYEALQAVKVPSKYLQLPSGGHGLNGYKGPMWDAWQEQSLGWLREIGMMPAEQ
jgi:acetyl esterase/lipase